MPIRRWIFHTDSSMPNQRLLPGEDVLVHAVDQGSVQVEQHRRSVGLGRTGCLGP